MIKKIEFQSSKNNEMINITERVAEIVKDANVEEGVCFIYSPHTTAGVTVTTTADPATIEDILREMDNIVPTRVNFGHTVDTPADAAGHVKVVLVGNSVQLPIYDGKLQNGHSQAVIFYEFDGPRNRQAIIQILLTK